MTEEERAVQYAAMFTDLEARGHTWWYCAPTDGRVWRTKRLMKLGDYVISRPEGADRWRVST